MKVVGIVSARVVRPCNSLCLVGDIGQWDRYYRKCERWGQ